MVDDVRPFSESPPAAPPAVPEAPATTAPIEAPKKKVRRFPEYLPENEARALLGAPYANNIRDRAILGLMAAMGLRVSEVIGLLKRDIQFGEHQVLLQKHDELEAREKSSGDSIGPKRGKPRSVPLDVDVTEQLRHLVNGLADEDQIFPLNRKSVHSLVVRYAKRAGIKRRVHPHTLRHTFAVHFLKGGGNIAELQRILGHTKAETTTIYLQLTSEDLKEAMAKHRPKYMRGE